MADWQLQPFLACNGVAGLVNCWHHSKSAALSVTANASRDTSLTYGEGQTVALGHTAHPSSRARTPNRQACPVGSNSSNRSYVMNTIDTPTPIDCTHTVGLAGQRALP